MNNENERETDDELDFSLLSDYLFDDDVPELEVNVAPQSMNTFDSMEMSRIRSTNDGMDPNLQYSPYFSHSINNVKCNTTKSSSSGTIVSSGINKKITTRSSNTSKNKDNSSNAPSSSFMSTIPSKRGGRSRPTNQQQPRLQNVRQPSNPVVLISEEQHVDDDVTLSSCSNSIHNLNNFSNKFDDSNMSADRRRERNRVLARKTRLRKKFFFESLQRQVAQLAKENEMLKGILKKRVRAEISERILSDCNTELPAIVTQTASHANSLLDKADFGLMSAIQAAQRSFCISDPSLPDNPIVFASKGFLDLTGYKLNEVIGRNCRFLQGPETDQVEVMRMRECILRGDDTSITLTNYKADGTPFVNQIFVAALRDFNNRIVNYVGVQVEVKSVDDSKTFEDEAILALPAAKKGRPRTRDRDKVDANGNIVGKNDSRSHGKNVIQNPMSSSTSKSHNIPVQIAGHMQKRQKMEDSTDSSGMDDHSRIAVSSSEESSLKNFQIQCAPTMGVNFDSPAYTGVKNVVGGRELVSSVYSHLDVAAIFMDNEDFSVCDNF